jgi:hypothetical protein
VSGLVKMQNGGRGAPLEGRRSPCREKLLLPSSLSMRGLRWGGIVLGGVDTVRLEKGHCFEPALEGDANHLRHA